MQFIKHVFSKIEFSFTDLPEFTVIPSDTVIGQSGTLSLLCQGQAVEGPSVTWYRGREGELIQLRNDIRVTVTESGLLQIKVCMNIGIVDFRNPELSFVPEGISVSNYR